MMTKELIEALHRVTLTRGWHLDGAGPARFGWAIQHPCKVEYIGRTLWEVENRLLARSVRASTRGAR